MESIETAKDEQPEDAKGVVSLEPEMKTDELPTPAYGSKEYWEDRYKNKTDEETQGKEGDPEPYHAWYFKFEDLAPILMPLIVGSAAADAADDDDGGDAEETKEEENGDEPQKKTMINNEIASSSHISPQKTDSLNNLEGVDDDVEQKNKNPDDVEQIDADKENNGEDSDAGSYEEIEGYEVDEMDEDEDEDRVGLAKNGPISVLEVGCGDAPLGQDLATSIQEFGSKNGSNPSKIIKKVVCLDYSKNVIDTMKQEQEQQQEQSKEKTIPVHYEVGDARKLSYENESFEVILEKGTLDAMLSDSDGQGQTNCRKIVSECARVLTIGGYIIIISHLNAQVESGLAWLNDVIVPGLRASGKFEWLIEVHGSEIEIESDDDDDEDKEVESPGPAVYFITKIGVLAQAEASEDSEQEPPTIPLKFFSY